jgi:hypothetical protein
VKVAFVTVFTLVLSIQFPSNSFADGYPCQISVETTRIDVSDWSTDSIRITTSPNSFAYLGNYPKTCRTTVNGGYFDSVIFNSKYDFGHSNSVGVAFASLMNGIILREGSNTVESCAVSNNEPGDFCSTAVITGYKKITVPGYVPPKLNAPTSTPNSGSSGNLICTEVTRESKSCTQNINSTWSYENCWSTNANKMQLEKWNKSKKRFEKVKTFKIAKSKQCEKKYPKLVKFNFSESDNKNKTYRIKFIGDSGGPEEKVKVTFE